MNNIQDIHALEQRIYDIVQDYIDGNMDDDDVLAVCRHCGQVSLDVDSPKAVKVDKTTEIYPLKTFVCSEEDFPTLDNDKISELANKWIFVWKITL